MDDNQTPPINPNATVDYSYKDIHDEKIEDIPNMTPEPPKEEPTVVEEPEIPLEDVVKQTAQEVIDQNKPSVEEIAKATADELVERAKVQEPQDDAYTAWAKQFEQDNDRTPNWAEAAEFIKDRAKAEIKAEDEALKAEEAKKQEEAQKVAEEETKRINAYVDDELSELYNAGKLTKIEDPNNPSDQGVIERKALFSKWAEVNAQRKSEGKPEILSPTRIFDFYYTKPNAQPAGADAPISGNKGSAVPPSQENSYSYKDIHKASWDRLIPRK